MITNPTYEELQQKAEDLEGIFNLSLDMIGSGNLDGYFTKINPSFKQILGYTDETFLANPFLFFVHDEDIEKTKKALSDAAKGKKTINIMNRYKCKDGSYKWIEWKVLSIVQENKFIAVGRQISKRQLSEGSLGVFMKAVEASSDAIGMSTAEGVHYYQNQSFDEMFGDIGTDPPTTLYVDEKIGREVFETTMRGTAWNGEVKMHGKGGEILNILLRAYPIKDEKGKVKQLVGVHTNITDRLNLENTLLKERDKAQNYLDIAAVMIVVVNSDETISLINKKGCEILGYDEKEIVGLNWIDNFIPHRYASKVKNIHAKLMAGEMYPAEHTENPVVSKSGEERFISWHNTILKDDAGNNLSTLSSGVDITERKKAEEALQKAHDELELQVLDRTKALIAANDVLQLEIKERIKAEKQLMQSREQLRHLSQYLQSSTERERARIAREVHDDLGQVLTAIKMDIAWLGQKMNKSQRLLIEKADSTKDLVDQAIKTVKKITSELRPGLLDDLGLVAAIEWYAEDFENRFGIYVKLKVDLPDMNLPADFSMTIFRIVQEALTNVARHSQATEVKVALIKKDHIIKLEVSDNGVGITEEKIDGRDSFGLLGIKERVHILGGKVEIFCMPEGTRVSVVVPVK